VLLGDIEGKLMKKIDQMIWPYSVCDQSALF